MLLRYNQGEPNFPDIIEHGLNKFEEVYYDRQGILGALGIRVRRRGGNWQACKPPTSSLLMDNQFFGRHEVAELLSEHLGNVEIGHGGASGLDEIARFITVKETWQVERVKVIVEALDFGSVIGSAIVTKELETFMKVHGWAFPGQGKAVGKLSAFFAWKDAQQKQSSKDDVLDIQI